MKLPGSANKKTFNFTVNASVLLDHIAKINSVTSLSQSGVDKAHFIAADGSSLYVAGMTPDSNVIIRLPEIAAVKGVGIFEFNPALLGGLLKNRKTDFEFEYNGSGKTVFKSTKGKYGGDFDTATVAVDLINTLNELTNSEEDKKNKLSPQVMALLKDALNMTKLVDVFFDKSLHSLIELKDGELSVSASDQCHIALYQSKDQQLKGNFRLALTSSAFNIINKIADGSVKFMVNEQFKVLGNNFWLAIPPIQVQDEDFSGPRDYIKTKFKNPQATVVLQAGVDQVIDNMNALRVVAKTGDSNSADSKYEIETNLEKREMSLELKTPVGSTREVVKVTVAEGNKKAKEDGKKKRIKATMNPITLSDTVKLLKGVDNVEMSFYPEAVVFKVDQQTHTLTLVGARDG
jgi:hypothetical protein